MRIAEDGLAGVPFRTSTRTNVAFASLPIAPGIRFELWIATPFIVGICPLGLVEAGSLRAAGYVAHSHLPRTILRYGCLQPWSTLSASGRSFPQVSLMTSSFQDEQ